MYRLSRLAVYYFIDLSIENPKYITMQKHRLKSKRWRKIGCISLKACMQGLTLLLERSFKGEK